MELRKPLSFFLPSRPIAVFFFFCGGWRGWGFEVMCDACGRVRFDGKSTPATTDQSESNTLPWVKHDPDARQIALRIALPVLKARWVKTHIKGCVRFDLSRRMLERDRSPVPRVGSAGAVDSVDSLRFRIISPPPPRVELM